MDLSRVSPWVGLGDVHLGESRDAVRSLLGGRYQSFHKTPGSPLVDAYNDLGFHLYFDPTERVTFIEAFPPSCPEFQGIRLLEGKPVYAVERLRKRGHPPRWHQPTYYFDDLGLALYVPYDSVEAVGIFRRDEYDRLPSTRRASPPGPSGSWEHGQG
jgi:hypothetical protein